MASFQKRHYQAIAAIIAETLPDCQSLDNFVARLSSYFAQDNERFNRDTFAAACRGEDYRGKPRQRKE